MKKLHLSAPRVSKKVLLITAGLLVVLALLGVGMIAQVKNERLQDAEVAQAAVAQKAKDDATAKQLADLQAQVKVSESRRVGVCTYVSSLTKQRIVQQYVAVPLVYCQ